MLVARWFKLNITSEQVVFLPYLTKNQHFVRQGWAFALLFCLSHDERNQHFHRELLKTFVLNNCFNQSLYQQLYQYKRVFDTLFEVSVVKTFKCFAVSCFVTSHFVNCVVDSIVVLLFCKFCKFKFTLCCTVFCFDAKFEVALC